MMSLSFPSLTLLVVTILALSSIVQPHPVETKGLKVPKAPIVHARSPSPRMIPGSNDLLSEMLARVGVQNFDKFNNLDKEQEYNDPPVIDDSHSANSTKTSHGNLSNNNGDVSGGARGGMPDPTKDMTGFIDTLFSSLSHKFKNVLDSSDEISLR